MADNDKKDQIVQDESKIDEYELINCIAMGKFTAVWEVMLEGTSQRFAMKLMLPEALADPAQLRVLKYEAKVAKALDHPSLMKLIKGVYKKKETYLILELFKATNLKVFILNDVSGVQLRLRKLVEGLCLGLGHIHDRGWVHRDVKPDNILLSKSSEMKLIDYSLSARAAGGLSKLLGGKTIQGTRTYIAPETIKKKAATPQTDIYSMGITLFEILTGTPPFKGSSPNELLKMHIGTPPPPPSELNPNVTPEMDRLVLRLLAKKPKDRPNNMREIHSEFRALKPFKEDIQDRIDAEKEKEGEIEDMLSSRLDSRADALRQEEIKRNPEFAKADAERIIREKAEKEVKERETAARIAKEKEKANRKTGHTTHQQPAMPMQPAAQFPQQAAPPFAAMPQQPMQPMMPMPQQPQPMQPVMPMPQQPMYPAAPIPQQPIQPEIGMPQPPAQPGMPQQFVPQAHGTAQQVPAQVPQQPIDPAVQPQQPLPEQQPAQQAVQQPQQPVQQQQTPLQQQPVVEQPQPNSQQPAAEPKRPSTQREASPAAAAQQPKQDDEEDLPFMEELPDVL